jgi:hypothetical protein
MPLKAVLVVLMVICCVVKYHTYGINIQAVCDHRCRFVEVAICAPGRSNDIKAFKKCSTWVSIQTLLIGNFIVGNNAQKKTQPKTPLTFIFPG